MYTFLYNFGFIAAPYACCSLNKWLFWVTYLRVCEVCAQHLSDVLCVRQVQSCVHLVQDVDGSGFEKQHGQDERQSHKWPDEEREIKVTISHRLRKHNKEECKVSNLCPPLSSVRFSFQVSPKATLNSRPSRTPHPWGGASLAVAPGSKVEKMEPKSLFTCRGRIEIEDGSKPYCPSLF